MKKFEFPLARVLAWRRAQATLERNRLEQLRLRWLALVERREALRRESLAAATEAARPGAESSGRDLEAREQFARFARDEGERLAQAVAAAGREVAAQQARVQAAEQASQLLEKLEGRRHREWQDAAAKELEELASDVFMAKWASRR